MTVSEALAILNDAATHRIAHYETLRECLASMSRDGSLPSPKTIGRMLLSIKDRPAKGFVLRSTPYKGTQRWRVESVSAPRSGGFGGFGGFDSTLRGKDGADSGEGGTNNGVHGSNGSDGSQTHQSHQTHHEVAAHNGIVEGEL